MKPTDDRDRGDYGEDQDAQTSAAVD